MPINKLPGVLSLTRGLMITDALFENHWESARPRPVAVIRHGIRGTQNVVGKDKDVSNIQTTETAKLDPSAEGMRVHFSLAFLDLQGSLFACASSKGGKDDIEGFRQIFQAFIKRAQSSQGLHEVGRRLARNILNGRWLWRNRTLAQAIHIQVEQGDELLVQADALQYPLYHFDDYSEEENSLGKVIADSLAGRSHVRLKVTATLDFGTTGPLEVFPSQNYLSNKPKKGFARPLYYVRSDQLETPRHRDPMDIQVLGQAALRDQKVSNALRTIDTWYPGFEEHGHPIAIEPNGASLSAQKFFRDGKTSAFRIALRLDELDPDTPDGMFMIGALIRGGVYSGDK